MLCAIIATVLFIIAGVIEVSDEQEFAGLTWQAFAVFGLAFFAAAHWVDAGIVWIRGRA